MKSKIFITRNQAIEVDTVLLLIRLIFGYAFIMHGWGKIQTPMSWMGASASVPGVLQALGAIAEFGGGIALVLGLLTRLGALGIACNMTVAVLLHRFVFGDPFINPTGGRSYEPAVVYLLFSLLFLVMGPGRYSLDKKFFGSKK